MLTYCNISSQDKVESLTLTSTPWAIKLSRVALTSETGMNKTSSFISTLDTGCDSILAAVC